MKEPKPIKSRRGRPSLAQASAIDKMILEVAQNLFLSSGFDQVSMEQIVAAAGVSKGTLYARYSSKEALFGAVIMAAIRRWSAEAAREDDLLTDDIDQRLRHHARTIQRFVHRPDVLAMQRLIMASSGRFPKLAATMHDRGYRYIVDLIARDIIEAEKAEGRIPRDAQGVAHMLYASLTGIHMDPHASEDIAEAAPAIMADRLVDMLMAARSKW